MPLSADVVGAEVGALDVPVDARWLMSYAAGVPDDRPELYDTIVGLVVHPLFPVAVEWQHVVSVRALAGGLTPDEARRGIHASHDLQIDRLPRPGEVVRVSATIVAVGKRRAGATQDVQFVARTTVGESLWRTTMTSLFLGVELVGEPQSIGEPTSAPPAPRPDVVLDERRSVVRLVDAHVYSECARIWNPIHTDLTAARAAGLADPILHGTATLARAVSAVTAMREQALTDVQRVTAAFRQPVELGTELTVRLRLVEDQWSVFDVVRPDGVIAVSGAVSAVVKVGDVLP
jgi:acyl dehydratase